MGQSGMHLFRYSVALTLVAVICGWAMGAVRADTERSDNTKSDFVSGAPSEMFELMRLKGCALPASSSLNVLGHGRMCRPCAEPSLGRA